jgi:LemA protein
MPIWLIVIIVVIVIILIWIWALYNGLVKLNIRVNEAWSDIAVQLKRRADLFGNLVETVKASANFEQSTIENVTKARTGLTNALDGRAAPADIAKAENNMNALLKDFNVENYPQLKTVENFGSMMTEISDTEDKIQASRRFYNSGVAQFNTKIKMFPNNIFAKHLGFSARDMFDTDDRAELEKGQDASKSNVDFSGIGDNK